MPWLFHTKPERNREGERYAREQETTRMLADVFIRR
jgi:hypothetical protein